MGMNFSQDILGSINLIFFPYQKETSPVSLRSGRGPSEDITMTSENYEETVLSYAGVAADIIQWVTGAGGSDRRG